MDQDKATPLAAKVAEIEDQMQDAADVLRIGPTQTLTYINTLLAIYATFKAMPEALRNTVEAFQSRCESWDDWCGGVDCHKCGSDARIIAAALAALADATVTAGKEAAG